MKIEFELSRSQKDWLCGWLMAVGAVYGLTWLFYLSMEWVVAGVVFAGCIICMLAGGLEEENRQMKTALQYWPEYYPDHGVDVE